MKVAIIHYWLVGMRGGEKVIEALCEMYPQADIFTHVYVPEMVSDRLRRHRIIPTLRTSLPRRIRTRQGDHRALRGASRLLLPYANALYLEHVSRLPEKRRPGCTTHDATAYTLPADVGRDVGGAGRQLCCELGNGCTAYSPLLRRGFR